MGEVIVIVPVRIVQVGCTTVAVAEAGLAGIGLTDTKVAVDIQRVFTSRTVIENVVFGVKLAKVVVDW